MKRRAWPRPMTPQQASSLRALYGDLARSPGKTASQDRPGDAIPTRPSPGHGGKAEPRPRIAVCVPSGADPDLARTHTVQARKVR